VTVASRWSHSGRNATHHEALVPHGKSLGQVRILGQQVFGVADLEHRGDEVDLPLRGRRLDPLEVGEVHVVHERQPAEVGILEEESAEADLRRAVHEADELVDVPLLREILGIVDPLFAERERLEDRRGRRGGGAPREDRRQHHSTGPFHGAAMLSS